MRRAFTNQRARAALITQARLRSR